MILHPLPPLEKLTGVEPVSGPKTIKSILKSKSTFKAETLKGITVNKPSSAPARGNKSSSVSKTNLALVDINQYHTGQSKSSSRSRPSRPSMPFPSCIYCGYNDHQFDDFIYYPICEICGSYDHDTHGHNRIISLRRGIKPRNLRHITKNCETCGSNVHTTFDHNDIEWFKKREALQAKKAEPFKASKTESSNTLRSNTPTKSTFLNDKPKEEVYVKQPPVNTPMVPPNKLGPDLNNKATNESQYRGIIGPLMNLTASRPNIQFSTTLCKTSRKHKESHLIFVENFQNNETLTVLDATWDSKNSSENFQLLEGMLNIDSKPEASVLAKEN
ncbi:hypothetical protein Tco_1355218 [Tanacetum coccineum]